MGHSTPAQLRAQSKYEKSPKQVKEREARNLARRHMEKLGLVHKGDGKDVMHKDGHALHNFRKNWGVGSQHKNRSYARTKNAHKKDPRS